MRYTNLIWLLTLDGFHKEFPVISSYFWLFSFRFGDQVQHLLVLRDGKGKYFFWFRKFDTLNKLIEHHRTSSVSVSENIYLTDMIWVSKAFIWPHVTSFNHWLLIPFPLWVRVLLKSESYKLNGDHEIKSKSPIYNPTHPSLDLFIVTKHMRQQPHSIMTPSYFMCQHWLSLIILPMSSKSRLTFQ